MVDKPSPTPGKRPFGRPPARPAAPVETATPGAWSKVYSAAEIERFMADYTREPPRLPPQRQG